MIENKKMNEKTDSFLVARTDCFPIKQTHQAKSKNLQNVPNIIEKRC